MTDYYADLGVSKNASADEIKKAYRKLAQKHHPDRGGNEADFKKINEAYDTLSDSAKKAQYDAPAHFGHNDMRGNTYTGPFPNSAEDLHDFVHTVFGAGFSQRRPPAINRNITLQYEIDLVDAYLGVDRELNINLPGGFARHVNVKIPPGVKAGSKIKFAGLGDNTYPSVPPGDLIIVIRINESSTWHRKNNDLITTVKIDVFDAILGCTLKVQHIDGKHISVKIPKSTQPNAKIRLKGQGLQSTNANIRGSLILLVEVSIPTKLSVEQRKLLESAKNLR
jgi:curved DNA-binding protein